MPDFQYKALNLAINTDALCDLDARAFRLLRMLQSAPNSTLKSKQVIDTLGIFSANLPVVVGRANALSNIHRIDRPHGRLILRRKGGEK